MTQLRHDYQKFKDLNTEVLVMVPNGHVLIEKYIQNNHLPYLVLSDKGSRVAAKYFQVKRFFLIGTPTIFVVDPTGTIRYTHYAASVTKEPDNAEPLAVLASMNVPVTSVT